MVSSINSRATHLQYSTGQSLKVWKTFTGNCSAWSRLLFPVIISVDLNPLHRIYISMFRLLEVSKTISSSSLIIQQLLKWYLRMNMTKSCRRCTCSFISRAACTQHPFSLSLLDIWNSFFPPLNPLAWSTNVPFLVWCHFAAMTACCFSPLFTAVHIRTACRCLKGIPDRATGTLPKWTHSRGL